MDDPLNNTRIVILGLLADGPKSGYDIKQKVDITTKFFWSASYGRIYPELKALEEAGLVSSRSDAQGGRQRVQFELTERGNAALQHWLATPGDLIHEIRDEGLLRLFFSDNLPPDVRRANLLAMAERYERIAATLREIIERAPEPDSFKCLTAQFGIDMYDFVAEWCRRTEAELTD